MTTAIANPALKKQAPLPAWLAPGAASTPAEREAAKAISSNWLKISNAFPTLSEKMLLVLIVEEMRGRGRLDIIDRVRKRFLLVRANRERAELTRRIGG